MPVAKKSDGKPSRERSTKIERKRHRIGCKAVGRAMQICKCIEHEVIVDGTAELSQVTVMFTASAKMAMRVSVRTWAAFIVDIANSLRIASARATINAPMIIAALVASPLHGSLSSVILSRCRAYMTAQAPNKGAFCDSFSHANALLHFSGARVRSRAAELLGIAMDSAAESLCTRAAELIPPGRCKLTPLMVCAALRIMRLDYGIFTNFILDIEPSFALPPDVIEERCLKLQSRKRKRVSVKPVEVHEVEDEDEEEGEEEEEEEESDPESEEPVIPYMHKVPVMSVLPSGAVLQHDSDDAEDTSSSNKGSEDDGDDGDMLKLLYKSVGQEQSYKKVITS